MNKFACVSVSKDFGTMEVNEDAALAKANIIAVSDGAGGGGVFAERWSRYLLDNLPETPIASFIMLDEWIDGIWESFYKECEEKARQQGGMFLDKFYDEGSFATLAAVWRVSDVECRWMSYGDSVVFNYDTETGILQHSFAQLADFNNPPYLISSKDPLDNKGFRCGSFHTSPSSIVFAASDALSHAILALYKVDKQIAGCKDYDEELATAANLHTRNSMYIKSVLALHPVNFHKKIIDLTSACTDENQFKNIIKQMKADVIIATDDYSLAMMTGS
ncbi:MAG: hypothetical protein J1E37_02800 [Prevotella sp.]|nr:hypothetical protein [Prevotella sp.]